MERCSKCGEAVRLWGLFADQVEGFLVDGKIFCWQCFLDSFSRGPSVAYSLLDSSLVDMTVCSNCGRSFRLFILCDGDCDGVPDGLIIDGEPFCWVCAEAFFAGNRVSASRVPNASR